MRIKDPITTIQAGAILKCDPSAIRHRTKAGTLDFEKMGRDIVVSQKAVEKIRDSQNGEKRGPKSNGKRAKKRR